MSKHTPGPWELRGWSVKCPTNNFRVARIGEADKALRQFGDYEDMEAECRANARLIAAAPELLEACQTVLAGIERGLPIDADTVNGLVVARLRTAIDKAKGRA